MAEGYANSSLNWPRMSWTAADLSKEWERFYQHCEFTFGGPLSKCTEKEKICNLMSFVGDKGREIYLTFQWKTVQVGSGESAQNVNEKDILRRVSESSKHTWKQRRTQLWRQLNLIEDASYKGKRLTPLSPILSSWPVVWT